MKMPNGDNLEKLFNHMHEGTAYCQMVYEDEKAVDWIYMDVNESFAKLTGLSGTKGKRVSELVPGIHKDNPELLEIYGRVAAGGGPEKFRTYVPGLRRWFKVVVYSTEKGTFIAVFENITERMKDRDSMLDVLSFALDMRDGETQEHTQRVAEMTVRLCRLFDFSDVDLTYARWGALLHDAGKLAVPDDILKKNGSLQGEELRVMRQHPEIAYRMFSQITFLRDALDIPYCHHENWDGTGYPRGINGEVIPLAARIFAVVDVYDAMVSDRHYRKAMSQDEALSYIREQSGKKFDPVVVEKFVKMISNHKGDF